MWCKTNTDHREKAILVAAHEAKMRYNGACVSEVTYGETYEHQHLVPICSQILAPGLIAHFEHWRENNNENVEIWRKGCPPFNISGFYEFQLSLYNISTK